MPTTATSRLRVAPAYSRRQVQDCVAGSIFLSEGWLFVERVFMKPFRYLSLVGRYRCNDGSRGDEHAASQPSAQAQPTSADLANQRITLGQHPNPLAFEQAHFAQTPIMLAAPGPYRPDLEFEPGVSRRQRTWILSLNHSGISPLQPSQELSPSGPANYPIPRQSRHNPQNLSAGAAYSSEIAYSHESRLRLTLNI